MSYKHLVLRKLFTGESCTASACNRVLGPTAGRGGNTDTNPSTNS
jgi:hypothetical protein